MVGTGAEPPRGDPHGVEGGGLVYTRRGLDMVDDIRTRKRSAEGRERDGLGHGAGEKRRDDEGRSEELKQERRWPATERNEDRGRRVHDKDRHETERRREERQEDRHEMERRRDERPEDRHERKMNEKLPAAMEKNRVGEDKGVVDAERRVEDRIDAKHGRKGERDERRFDDQDRRADGWHEEKRSRGLAVSEKSEGSDRERRPCDEKSTREDRQTGNYDSRILEKPRGDKHVEKDSRGMEGERRIVDERRDVRGIHEAVKEGTEERREPGQERRVREERPPHGRREALHLPELGDSDADGCRDLPRHENDFVMEKEHTGNGGKHEPQRQEKIGLQTDESMEKSGRKEGLDKADLRGVETPFSNESGANIDSRSERGDGDDAAIEMGGHQSFAVSPSRNSQDAHHSSEDGEQKLSPLPERSEQDQGGHLDHPEHMDHPDLPDSPDHLDQDQDQDLIWESDQEWNEPRQLSGLQQEEDQAKCLDLRQDEDVIMDSRHRAISGLLSGEELEGSNGLRDEGHGGTEAQAIGRPGSLVQDEREGRLQQGRQKSDRNEREYDDDTSRGRESRLGVANDGDSVSKDGEQLGEPVSLKVGVVEDKSDGGKDALSHEGMISRTDRPLIGPGTVEEEDGIVPGMASDRECLPPPPPLPPLAAPKLPGVEGARKRRSRSVTPGRGNRDGRSRSLTPGRGSRDGRLVDRDTRGHSNVQDVRDLREPRDLRAGHGVRVSHGAHEVRDGRDKREGRTGRDDRDFRRLRDDGRDAREAWEGRSGAGRSFNGWNGGMGGSRGGRPSLSPSRTRQRIRSRSPPFVNAPGGGRRRSPLRSRSPRRRSPPPFRRSPARRSPIRRSPSRRSPARRSPARRSPARRSPARRSPARRSPGRRSPARHSPVRRSPAYRSSPPRGRGIGVGRPGNNLFVAGFNYITTERDLERKFSRFGRVTNVRIVRDSSRTQESRGFGFVMLERDENADEAIRVLNGTNWNGRIVLVEKAKSVPRP